MVLFFDTSTGMMSDREVSTVILSAQEVLVTPSKAESFAQDAGIINCADYRTNFSLFRSRERGYINRLS